MVRYPIIADQSRRVNVIGPALLHRGKVRCNLKSRFAPIYSIQRRYRAVKNMACGYGICTILTAV